MIMIIDYHCEKNVVNNFFREGNRWREKIAAHEELDQMLNEGWSIVSATTSESVSGAFGSTSSHTRLTVILQK